MKIILFTLTLLCLSVTLSAQDIYNYKNSSEYAAYLFKSGQYQKAGEELERLVFLDNKNDSLKAVLINAYFLGENYARTISRSNELFKTKDIDINSFRSVAKSHLELMRFDELRLLIDQNKKINKNILGIYKTHTYASVFNWELAKSEMAQIETTDSKASALYSSSLEKAFNAKRKKPALAGIMSTLIPSSGRFYAKDWKDGLVSIIFISGTAWQAYRAFKKNGSSSAFGWTMAGISLGFYGGNIYGSVKAAKDYNHRTDHRNLKELEEIFNSNF